MENLNSILIYFMVLGAAKLASDIYVTYKINKRDTRANKKFDAWEESFEKWKAQFEGDQIERLKEIRPELIDKLIALERERTSTCRESAKAWQATSETYLKEIEAYKIKHSI